MNASCNTINCPRWNGIMFSHVSARTRTAVKTRRISFPDFSFLPLSKRISFWRSLFSNVLPPYFVCDSVNRHSRNSKLFCQSRSGIASMLGTPIKIFSDKLSIFFGQSGIGRSRSGKRCGIFKSSLSNTIPHVPKTSFSNKMIRIAATPIIACVTNLMSWINRFPMMKNPCNAVSESHNFKRIQIHNPIAIFGVGSDPFPTIIRSGFVNKAFKLLSYFFPILRIRKQLPFKLGPRFHCNVLACSHSDIYALNCNF